MLLISRGKLPIQVVAQPGTSPATVVLREAGILR